jgi:hypothetical protein
MKIFGILGINLAIMLNDCSCADNLSKSFFKCDVSLNIFPDRVTSAFHSVISDPIQNIWIRDAKRPGLGGLISNREWTDILMNGSAYL